MRHFLGLLCVSMAFGSDWTLPALSVGESWDYSWQDFSYVDYSPDRRDHADIRYHVAVTQKKLRGDFVDITLSVQKDSVVLTGAQMGKIIQGIKVSKTLPFPIVWNDSVAGNWGNIQGFEPYLILNPRWIWDDAETHRDSVIVAGKKTLVLATYDTFQLSTFSNYSVADGIGWLYKLHGTTSVPGTRTQVWELLAYQGNPTSGLSLYEQVMQNPVPVKARRTHLHRSSVTANFSKHLRADGRRRR